MHRYATTGKSVLMIDPGVLILFVLLHLRHESDVVNFVVLVFYILFLKSWPRLRVLPGGWPSRC